MEDENMRLLNLGDLAGRWREYTDNSKWKSQLDIFEEGKYAYLIGDKEYDGNCTIELNLDDTINLSLTGYGKLHLLKVDKDRKSFLVSGPDYRTFKKV